MESKLLTDEELCQEALSELSTIQRPWTYLSSLGISLRKKGFTWTGKLNDVLQGCSNIALLPDPEIRERIYTCLEEHRDACAAQIGKVDAHRVLALLPRALILAFCVPIAASEKVYLSIGDKIRYHIAEAAISPDHIHVDERFRKPGLLVSKINEMSEENAKALFSSIQSWARLNDISLDALTAPTKPTATKPTMSSDNALSRLLAAIPQELRAQINIPADIAELLMKHL